MQVRMELQHKGRVDLMVTMTASVINDTQYSKPGSWVPAGNSGQPDLEASSLTRQLQVLCCAGASCLLHE